MGRTKYACEDLYPNQFEELVILICQKLLGIAVQGFSQGPDGGRDARFEGTAESYPSRTEPWSGRVVIQAKHTNGTDKSFSDSGFYQENGKTLSSVRKFQRSKRLKTLVS